nr:immunoglobulin light chain junction region [Macaca mulatta]
CQQAYSYPHSF